VLQCRGALTDESTAAGCRCKTPVAGVVQPPQQAPLSILVAAPFLCTQPAAVSVGQRRQGAAKRGGKGRFMRSVQGPPRSETYGNGQKTWHGKM